MTTRKSVIPCGEGTGLFAPCVRSSLLTLCPHQTDYSDKPPNDILEKAINLVIPSLDAEGCSAYPSRIDGSVALLRRGTCTFVAKVRPRKEQYDVPRYLSFSRLTFSFLAHCRITDQTCASCWCGWMHFLQQCQRLPSSQSGRARCEYLWPWYLIRPGTTFIGSVQGVGEQLYQDCLQGRQGPL